MSEAAEWDVTGEELKLEPFYLPTELDHDRISPGSRRAPHTPVLSQNTLYWLDLWVSQFTPVCHRSDVLAEDFILCLITTCNENFIATLKWVYREKWVMVLLCKNQCHLSEFFWTGDQQWWTKKEFSKNGCMFSVDFLIVRFEEKTGLSIVHTVDRPLLCCKSGTNRQRYQVTEDTESNLARSLECWGHSTWKPASLLIVLNFVSTYFNFALREFI